MNTANYDITSQLHQCSQSRLKWIIWREETTTSIRQGNLDTCADSPNFWKRSKHCATKMYDADAQFISI